MAYMNLAKISTNGQITVPVEIRRLLSLISGNKILFYQKQDGFCEPIGLLFLFCLESGEYCSAVRLERTVKGDKYNADLHAIL